VANQYCASRNVMSKYFMWAFFQSCAEKPSM
jgi:hypothetical protein